MSERDPHKLEEIDDPGAAPAQLESTPVGTRSAKATLGVEAAD